MGDRTVRRRRTAFAGGLAAMALALGFAAVPAQAALPIAYVALGDSYAAGLGAGSYLDTVCHRSANSYPADANVEKSVRLAINAACSGATTQVVAETQLTRLNKSIKVVTLTAGGNDLDTTGIVKACSLDPNTPECGMAVANARYMIESGTLFTRLTALLQAVHAKAPAARVYVTGYPLLFHSPAPDSLQASVNVLTLALNAVILRAAGPGQFVDVSAAFLGHGIGSTDPWINYGTADPSDDFHPNTAGYRAYYSALLSAGAYSTP